MLKCMRLYVRATACGGQKRELDSLELQSGNCEPPDMGIGN